MAWTTPRTWTDTELVTAAIMNPHIRDNLNAIGPIFHIRKTADESVTLNATPQNDDHLLFAIAANEVWTIQCVLFYTNNNNANAQLKVGWSVPAAATGTWSWLANAASAATEQGMALSIATTDNNIGQTISGDQVVRLNATVVNSSTAGNVTLQWSQSASDATATSVKTNSTLLAHRIA